MRNVLIGFFAFFLLACDESNPLKINKEDVKIVCAKDWEITDTTFTEEYSFVRVERDINFDSHGGNIFFRWNQDSLNLESYIYSYQKQLKNTLFFKEMKCDTLKINTYHGYKGVSSNFELSLLGVKQVGRIYTFHAYNKTFLVFYHHSIKDTATNSKELDFIENNFSVGVDSLLTE